MADGYSGFLMATKLWFIKCVAASLDTGQGQQREEEVMTT
jgi:hypothetical protein